jgi:hypothetical protein
MKLFPILATLFAHNFTSELIYGMYGQQVADIEKGEFGMMDIMHHLTAGGKSLFT